MEQGRRVQRQEPERRPQQTQRRSQPERGPQQTPNNRKKKTGGSLFSNPLVFLLFIFGISAILAALCWTAANDVLALNKTFDKGVITIEEGDSYSSVVNQLKDEGIIEYKFVFRAFSLFAGGKDKVTPGTYELNTNMDYRAIINGLSSKSDSRMTAWVTIPEGYNIDQIFELLEERGVSYVSQLQKTAAEHDYNFSFLQELPLGDYRRLEGYLFPDTYKFYMGEDPKYVINKMLVNFDARVTDEMRQAIWDSGYSIHDVVVIASIIEKESDGDDRANISSVIYNRLERPSSELAGRYLQIDATIQYVLEKGERVTVAHYESVDSPYNTYLNEGLPPGPISNPGMACIYAAMNPNSTNYYYYSLGEDEVHHFFNTKAEHDAFIAS